MVQPLETMTPEQRRNARLEAVYGISLDQYNQMLQQQNGECLICGRLPSPNRVLVVDHNHDTGQVRALLCSECNTALGLLGDDPDNLKRAQAYLLRFGAYPRGELPQAGTDTNLVKQDHPDLRDKSTSSETTGDKQ